jgi:hypothetical protein
LLWGLGVFFVVQLYAALLVTEWLPELRQPDYVQKVQRLEALQARTPQRTLTVVALGSSRTVNGLIGNEAERVLQQSLGHPVTVCNFGAVGASPFTELLILRRLLEDGHRPDFLLVEVLPAQLHAGYVMEDSREHYLPTVAARHSELDYLAEYGHRRERGALDWWLQWLAPAYTYRTALLPACHPLAHKIPPLMPDAWGWFPLRPEQLASRSARLLEEAHRFYGDYLQHLDPGGHPVELLTMLLDLCRRERIPVALVLMPEGPTFRSWYGPGKLEHFRTFLNDLGQRHGVSIVDAMEWVDSDADYFDSHHLWIRGAEKYTHRLAGEALPPLLRGYPSPERGSQFAKSAQN